MLLLKYVDANSINPEEILFERDPYSDMASNDSPAPFMVTSNDNSANAFNAFTNESTSEWVIVDPSIAWIMISGVEKFYVKRLLLRGSWSGQSGVLTRWFFEGSNDAINWSTLAHESYGRIQQFVTLDIPLYLNRDA